jgi:glycosyltransferase involved in cell wall biosynthesis
MKPLAIVTPWFGRELKGGAEQQAWQVATRLADRGHEVEVLTTCCCSFQDDWATNYYKAGVQHEAGVTIRRFPVQKRDRQAFDLVNGLMLALPPSRLKVGVNPVTPEYAAKFCSENINSPKLMQHLQQKEREYCAFLFLPYLYGCILNGLPKVSSRAFLQPCLHDEVYAYLPEVAQIFYAAKKLLFLSDGEAQLATNLYGPSILAKSLVAGAGVEVDRHYAPVAKIRDFETTQNQFILCLGRRDVGKNTPLLVQAFIAFKQKHPETKLKLVLAGTGAESFENLEQGVIDLGLVAENEKAALLSNCLALFQPSRNESYSRVLMEAWLYGKPVAGNRECLAVEIAIQKSQGGWLATTIEEWTALFAQFEPLTDKFAQIGAKGREYAQNHGSWEQVMARYEAALELIPQQIALPKKPKLREIHQLLPNLAYGDAISNHALTIRDSLRDRGYESEIFVRYLDDRIASQAKVFKRQISAQAGLIYHHSIGSELTEYAISHPGAKCLIYHNITPAKFFQPYRPDFAVILDKGRAELQKLAPYFKVSVGDSAYNAAELASVGFEQPGVLPIAVDPGKWNISASATLMEQLQDGKSNLLFVGRITPNKCQEQLVEAFYYYLTMDAEARLILVGEGNSNDPYYHHLLNTIDKFNLSSYVLMPGQVNDAQLLAYYRTADLFWSMSEHEGFGVPLVEAMWFDIPVLAYKSSAVPETLGASALMFNNKEDLVQVAALAKLLIKDRALQSKVINVQRQRRENFTPQAVSEILSRLILKIEGGV